MTLDSRRITLVLVSADSPERAWNDSSDSESRLIFVKVLTLLQCALSSAVSEFNRDVERVILDHAVTDAQFLDLLAALPQDFAGDVLNLRANGTGFLSAAGRGGDRVLYAITEHDVQFYFSVHKLTGMEQWIVAA